MKKVGQEVGKKDAVAMWQADNKRREELKGPVAG